MFEDRKFCHIIKCHRIDNYDKIVCGPKITYMYLILAADLEYRLL